MWFLGGCFGYTAKEFVVDVAARVTGSFQITSDGHSGYTEAVEAPFGADLAYVQLSKFYAAHFEG